MSRNALVLVAVAIAGGFLFGRVSAQPASEPQTRVFELRTYTAAEGKLDELNARFRDHTMRLFEKHGMTNVGYWVPMDEPGSNNTLVYLLAHDSREAAKESFAAFRKDPEWQKARDASEANGKLAEKVVSVFVTPTDYSPMK